MQAVRITTSGSGDNCDNACEAIGEECIEDMLKFWMDGPNHPGWDNGNRCGAQWDIRERICPCTSTLAESKSTTTPEVSTTELPDGKYIILFKKITMKGFHTTFAILFHTR